MPIVKVYGLPISAGTTAKKKYVQLVETIKIAIAGVPGMQLTCDQVTVKMPIDLLNNGKEIIVEVCKLYKKKERTKEVKDQVADNLAGAFERFVKDCGWSDGTPGIIEIFVEEFDPKKDSMAIRRY